MRPKTAVKAAKRRCHFTSRPGFVDNTCSGTLCRWLGEEAHHRLFCIWHLDSSSGYRFSDHGDSASEYGKRNM